MTDRESIIASAASYAKAKLGGESTGHDWFHTARVWKMARRIAEAEHADLFVVELAALLHDISDWKFNNGDVMAGAIETEGFLGNLGTEPDVIAHVSGIVANISYKGAKVANPIDTIEGMVVQDADRLDAIGAIGIARAFAYGGKNDREIYNPEIRPVLHETFEAYKNAKGTSINHFYEKLLLVKDRMNTETAKEIARQRHGFLEMYLEQFLAEWDGKK